MTDLLSSAHSRLRAEADEARAVVMERRNDLEAAQTALAIAEARAEQAQRGVKVLEAVLADPPDEARREPRQPPGAVENAVRRVLAKADVTVDEIAQQTAQKPASIKAALRRLVAKGELVERPEGWYGLAAREPAAEAAE